VTSVELLIMAKRKVIEDSDEEEEACEPNPLPAISVAPQTSEIEPENSLPSNPVLSTNSSTWSTGDMFQIRV